MIRTKIKTNKLPRITGAEAEFYNPYEHHKQNLSNPLLFPKGMPAFWDEERSLFWNPSFGIVLDKKPKAPKTREYNDNTLPDLELALTRAYIFAELSVQNSEHAKALVHVTDDKRTFQELYRADAVDLIRTKHPGSIPFICSRTQALVFNLPDRMVGIVMPTKVALTDYQIECLKELGFDKKYHINLETLKEEF